MKFDSIGNNWWHEDGLDDLIIYKRREQYWIHHYSDDDELAGPFGTLEAAKLAYMMLIPSHLLEQN